MTLKIGDKVIFKEKMIGACGIGGRMLTFQKNKIWGTVVNTTKNWKEIMIYVIRFDAWRKDGETYSSYDEDLYLITKEDYPKYQEIESNYKQEIESAKIDKDKYLQEVKQGDYKTFDFNRIRIANDEEVDLYTRVVYVVQNTDMYTSEFKEGARNIAADCCDFIKTTLSYKYFLPTYYLNYYGYSVEDARLWLNFISQLGFKFDYAYNGIDKKPIMAAYTGVINKQDLLSYETGIQSTINTEYLEIFVKSGQYSWHNYLYLLLMRYLHHQYYYWIPALAMQIHDEVDGCSHLEALLMAHFSSKYYTGTNGLVANNTFIDIFIDADAVMQKLNDRGMNNSFSYDNKFNCDINICANLVDERKFKQLYNYLKSGKNEN